MESSWSLIELFKIGGAFMWPLLAFSVAALTLIIDRIIYLFYHNVKMDKLTATTKEFLQENKIDDAIAFLEIQPRKNTGATILLSLLKNKKFGEGRMEKAAETEAMERIHRLENGFDWLSAISSLAPLTGFLGTVSGMIGAFKSIANAQDVNVQLVASGIYEALVTTVFGLIIAIVSLVAYNLFVRRVDTFSNEVTKSVNDLMPYLIDNSETNKMEK